MKLLLIQPPIQDFYDTDIRLQPIGLGYLKATLNKFHSDVDVKIVDFHQGHGRFPVPIPKELNYLKEFYCYPDKSPFRTFYQYFHFGASFGNIREYLLQERPDFVGISSLFTPYFREALKVAKISKELFPEVPIIFGGSHVNACPNEVLSCDEVDYIIKGEGEKGIVDFFHFIKGHIPITKVSNLGHKINGTLVFNSSSDNFDINEIPIPDFSDLTIEKYSYGKKPLTFLITSRSCPHKCSFCSVHQTFGFNYRTRHIDNVMNEIKTRFQQGYRIIDFEDDNLTFYKEQMKELCRKIIEEYPIDGPEFVAMNGISYISLDDELLELMKKARFTHLNLALVTSDQFVRKATKRPHTIDKYIEVVEKAHELGFKIVSYQIVGLPNETLDSMVQTLTFASQLPILLGASMFYLTPNSPIAKDFSYRDEKDRFLSRLTSMHIETYQMKRDQIYSLFVTTRIINFLKSFELDCDVHIDELLSIKFEDKEKVRGVNLLKKLIIERKLFADLGKEYKELKKFNVDIFENVFKRLPYIKTQNNYKIEMVNVI